MSTRLEGKSTPLVSAVALRKALSASPVANTLNTDDPRSLAHLICEDLTRGRKAAFPVPPGLLPAVLAGCKTLALADQASSAVVVQPRPVPKAALIVDIVSFKRFLGMEKAEQEEEIKRLVKLTHQRLDEEWRPLFIDKFHEEEQLRRLVREKLGVKGFQPSEPLTLLSDAVLCQNSGPHLSEHALKLDIPASGDFLRERVASPATFDPKSFRTVTQGDHRVIVGCTKGYWKAGQCSIGTRAQSILHPQRERAALVAEAAKAGVPVIGEAHQEQAAVHQHQDAPVDMAQVGPLYWARLHAWANDLKAEVSDSCGCGDLAVHAMQGFHDAVNVALGKPTLYPDDLRLLAAFTGTQAEALRSVKAQARRILYCPLHGCQPVDADEDECPECAEEAENGPEKHKKAANPHLNQGFLNFLLYGAATAAGASLGASLISKLLTPKATSPEDTIEVVDSKGVYSPKSVEGDQAQVDLGTLLAEIDTILRKPDMLGLVDPNTQKVLRKAS